MTQNIYDDPSFFAGYSELRRSREGLDGAQEWPSIAALLPDLTGRRVLDLGCGFGWFCRWARGHGAASVRGVDVSERMLARARAETEDPAIGYERADLEAITLAEGAYDLVYSSLAFHYLADLERLYGEVARALSPGGHFVFSVENPIYTASYGNWLTGTDGRRYWPVAAYAEEGERRSNWLAEGVVKYHRRLASYLNPLIRLGFTLAHVEDWAPTKAEVAAWPDLAEERERPMFLIVSAVRNGAP